MRRLACVCLAMSLSRPGAALFKEEAGIVDWRVENVGELRSALHPAVKSGIQRHKLLVSTKANVLASMDIRDGSISWRQVLAEAETVDITALSEKNLMSISGGGKNLRMWNAMDGGLRWSDVLYSSQANNAPSHVFDALFVNQDLSGDEVSDIAVVCDNMLQTRSGASGEQLWSHEWNMAKHGALSQLFVSQNSGPSKSLFAVSFVDGKEAGTASALMVKSFAMPSMTLAGEEFVETPAGVSGFLPGAVLVEEGVVVCLAAGGKLVIVRVDADGAESAKSNVLDLAGVEGAATLKALPLDGFFMVVSSSKSTVFEYKDGKVNALHTFDAPGSAVSATLEVRDKSFRVMAASVSAAGTQVEVVSFPEAKSAKFSFKEPKLASAGGATTIVPIVTRKRDGNVAQKCLLSTADHALHHLELSASADRNTPKWSRQEALSSVEQAIFVDNAPLTAAQRAAGATSGGLVTELKKILAKAQGGEAPGGPSATGGQSVRAERFGFRKITLLVSKAHKLFALDAAGKGEVLWSHYFGAKVQGAVRCSLVCLRMPGEGAADATGHCALVAKGAHSFLLGFDPVTGKVLDSLDFATPLVHVAALPSSVRTADRTRVLTVVDSEHTVHVYPAGIETEKLYAAFSNSFYFLVDAERSSISGYKAAPKVASKAEGKAGASAALWTFRLGEGEKWATMATRHPDEAVQSPVRVLGDGAAMYKHLNPNLLLVATTTEEPKSDESDPRMTIYLLDAVSGRTLSRTLHQNAGGPVSAVLCENWAVYHYWSHEKGGRYEVGVVELYDSTAIHLQTDLVLNVLKDGGVRPPFTSFAVKRPQVTQQSHVFQFPVTAMGVTRTRHGVTLRHVIMAMDSGQMYSLDKRLVDPRAPRQVPGKKPTAVQMQQAAAEGVLPYHGVTPIIPTRMLTYNFTLPRTKMIITEPATIESTCHVFSAGLDLFYTRTSPSGKFDLLSDDFSYALLVLWVIGMGTMCYMAAKMSVQQDLTKAWS